MAETPGITEWVEPRWFVEDFVNLYEQVKDTDPDIREEYHKWAHNARLWLEATTTGDPSQETTPKGGPKRAR